MDFPKELRYTNDHEWARRSGGTFTIGITAFAVEQLGDITLVDLPDVGQRIDAGETLGTIESVKSVSDLFSPISGRVTRVNIELEDRPELVNEDPYGGGWLVEMQGSGAEFDELLSSEDYAALVSEES